MNENENSSMDIKLPDENRLLNDSQLSDESKLPNESQLPDESQITNKNNLPNASICPNPVYTQRVETKSKVTLNRREAGAYMLSAVLLAFVYAICFSGVEVLPQLSFTFFCPIAFLTLTFTLKHQGLYKNKRSVYWLIPICIISLYNGIFSLNLFTYGNVVIMHMLFAAYTFSAMQEQRRALDSTAFLFNIFSNWLIFVPAIQSFTARKKENKEERKDASTLSKVIIGMLISAPVLLFILALLISADMVFGKLIEDTFIRLTQGSLIHFSFLASLVISWIFFTGYIYHGHKVCTQGRGIELAIIKTDVVISATFLILINLVFLLFSFVQVAYLFNGGFMTLPEGMVYSQYAREGFFQLLFVTVINFSVLIIFISVFEEARTHKLLKLLLLSLCFFTCILIASSVYRMLLYIDVYGYTSLRLWVLTFLAMEVVLLFITVLKLFVDRVRFLKLFVLTGLVSYLVVNITGSTFLVSKLNVDLFMAGKLRQISVSYGSPEDLYAIKPLLDEEKYVCLDYKIYRKEEATNVNAKHSGFDQLLMLPKEDQWQNWTLFRSLALQK